jgi:hypothetical protein
VIRIAGPYKDELVFTSHGIFGPVNTTVSIHSNDNMWRDPIVVAWLADPDWQRLELVSTNIGVVRTLTKQYNTPGPAPTNAPPNES